MYKTKVEWISLSDDVKMKAQFEEYQRRKRAYDEYFDDKLDIIPGLYYECQVFMQKLASAFY
ncbi:MAG: hypothetical protein NWE78_01955 [Candidatus Bathyarchaeota archaeon]|nr:hypothetical protein [Candidatus Bathyarchaeota archaeon]UCC28444.1 MAG: hypothetical protein JSW29_03115 [Candidatus Bathyarchaeota archaeon]